MKAIGGGEGYEGSQPWYQEQSNLRVIRCRKRPYMREVPWNKDFISELDRSGGGNVMVENILEQSSNTLSN